MYRPVRQLGIFALSPYKPELFQQIDVPGNSRYFRPSHWTKPAGLRRPAEGCSGGYHRTVPRLRSGSWLSRDPHFIYPSGIWGWRKPARPWKQKPVTEREATANGRHRFYRDSYPQARKAPAAASDGKRSAAAQRRLRSASSCRESAICEKKAIAISLRLGAFKASFPCTS